jgi:hypothetical protein
MMKATLLTDWGHMPTSFDVLLGSHIHLGSITSFDDNNDGTRNPPQIVIGNSGTQFVALSEPPNSIFELEVKKTEVMYQYGYLVATREKQGRGKSGKSNRLYHGTSEGAWLLEFKVCTWLLVFDIML